MPSNIRNSADFSETFAIHAALKHALADRLFSGDASTQQSAAALVKALESERSVYGKQLKLLRHMEKGATLDELGRLLRCSRRTVFRHLDHLKAAGIGITLKGHAYSVPRNLLRLISR